ncbi:NADH-quinone oxidoreductase subunit J [Blastococcus sp. BMG 814]|uniref:NADH-quinone oxidoreductase subunit J n=1 Tax=Blastococcus carthaginiensis TaxID=3050034 RepID=A0ABT9I9K8_9ACTN|nr:NADH-quinone oxidoreductase subunit J [Blastococcus carthaginiensis]MDP5181795.1 NADH-quinone oxidoreductase subunit J [Blastococcus carthaginiensis]
MVDDIVFWALAVVAVASGIAVFRVDSMARATYALAVSFVAVGLALLLFGLDYLGVVVVLMMVMEMAIMAIYMIMFMGMNPALMPMSMVHGKRTSLAVAGLTFAVLAAGILLVDWPERRGAPAADLTLAVGRAVMGGKMLVMMTVSAVLFATIVSALVLALPRGRYDAPADDAEEAAS